MPNSENKIYDSANDNELNENMDLNINSDVSHLANINSEIESEKIENEKDKNNTDEDKNNSINSESDLNDHNTKIANDASSNHNNITSVEIEIADALDTYNILTIDDDKWIQRIFSQYLSQWGFHNINAMDPYSGLEEAIKNKPLIIFLDILLPEVNGDTLIKFLKKLEFTSKIPVVIISGHLSKEIIKSTYIAGAAGFITKPFTQETLFNKIKEVIDPAIFNRMIKDGKINTSQIKKKPHLGV